MLPRVPVEVSGDVVVDDHADGPGAEALVALMAKVQVPRLIRAMFPAGNAGKVGGLTSRGRVAGAPGHVTGPVTSPLPE